MTFRIADVRSQNAAARACDCPHDSEIKDSKSEPAKARWYEHTYHTPLNLRIVFALIPNVPKLFHPPIAFVTALIFLTLLKKARQSVMKNLHHIAPFSKLTLLFKAYKVFYSFCDYIVSYCYVPRASHTELAQMLVAPDRGQQKIDSCLSRGAGLIIWTAHIGNYELGSRLLEMHGRRVNVARVVERDQPAELILRDLMSNDLLRIVDLSDGPLASLQLLHALRENEIVAMQGDRILHAHHADVRFFGTRAVFPLGPFLLSYLSGAPILPGFVVRAGWLKYRVVMGEPIVLQHTGDRERDMRVGVERAVSFLEETCRHYHDQWLNFYDFWPEKRI